MKLEEFYFYDLLDEKSRIYLQQSIKPINAQKGTILFFQGDTCEDILLLSRGKQCIVNTSSAISSSLAIATAETLCDIEGGGGCYLKKVSNS